MLSDHFALKSLMKTFKLEKGIMFQAQILKNKIKLNKNRTVLGTSGGKDTLSFSSSLMSQTQKEK